MIKSYWNHCERCGKKHRQVEGTEQCRPCRGWHVCSSCKTRKGNDEYNAYSYRGKPNAQSMCRECETAYHKRAKDAERNSRRTTRPNHDTAAQVYAAYEITRKERYVVQKALKAYKLHQPSTICRAKRPDHPTPIVILNEAGYGFDMRLSQAVIELYRLETAKREAA